MATESRTVQASPEEVWGVLANGWLYPSWVVGAARMRAVGSSYPAVGSRLHHSVGCWPVLVHDYTEVIDAEPHRRLRLRARGWPLGEAVVELRLSPDDAGGCRVEMTEIPRSGPALALDNPVGHLLLAARNKECLRRLAAMAEGHAH